MVLLFIIRFVIFLLGGYLIYCWFTNKFDRAAIDDVVEDAETIDKVSKDIEHIDMNKMKKQKQKIAKLKKDYKE